MTRTVSHRSSGYTLVELMLVCLLMGILFSVASSSWSGSGDYRLNLIQTEITDAVDYAKALARSSREAHGVVFEPSTERLGIVDESGTLVADELTKAEYLIDFTGPQYPKGIDLTSVDFGEAGAALVINPDGTALSTGTIVISCLGASRTLTVDPATAGLSGS